MPRSRTNGIGEIATYHAVDQRRAVDLPQKLGLVAASSITTLDHHARLLLLFNKLYTVRQKNCTLIVFAITLSNLTIFS